MPRAVVGSTTLDIPENQVLVTYPDDDPSHHHRVLFFRIAGGKWISSSQDYDVQIVDVLEEEGVIALARDAEFPVPVENVYTFPPFDQHRFDRLRAECRRLAIITGVDIEGPGQTASSDAKW